MCSGSLKDVGQDERRKSELWEPLWDKLLELVQPEPTHYNKAHDHVSRIGRMWTSLSKSMFIAMEVRAHVLADPVAMFKKKLSDHSPVRTVFRMALPLAPEVRPIARHIVKDKGFSVLVEAYLKEIDLWAEQPPQQYELMTTAIRAAAARIRDKLSSKACPAPAHQLALLISVGRAAATQNLETAKLLLRTSPFTKRFLQISGQRVVLKHAAEFNSLLCRHKQAEAEQKATKRFPLSGDRLQRAADQALRRRMQLWSRSQPRAVLKAVLVKTRAGQQESVSDELGKSAALAKHWGEVFGFKKVSDDAMNEFIQWQPALPVLPPPGLAHIRGALRCAAPTAPGPDGIPTAAWAACGHFAERHLLATLHYLANGYSMGWR